MTSGILQTFFDLQRKMRTAGLLFVVGLCLLDAASSLKICAFNIQSFGESKANNKKVMGLLLKVLRVSPCVYNY